MSKYDYSTITLEKAREKVEKLPYEKILEMAIQKQFEVDKATHRLYERRRIAKEQKQFEGK